MNFIFILAFLFDATYAFSLSPCQGIDCGENYNCVENTFSDYGFDCFPSNSTTDGVEIRKRSLYFENSCPTIRCQNGGLCRIDVQNMTSSCICKYPYVGQFCQTNGQWLMDLWSASERTNRIRSETIEDSNRDATNDAARSYFASYYNFPQNVPIGSGDICAAYRAANVELCRNGGYCISVFTGKAQCVCPITTSGDRCENLVYVHCPSPLQLCHKQNGNCVNGNQCVCEAGYVGPRCDEQAVCTSTYCLNGGTCKPTTTKPFRTCDCGKEYTGTRCENRKPAEPTPDPDRCDYSVSLRNTGGYIARLRIVYSLGGVRQPAVTSNTVALLERTQDIEIPSKATDIVVKIERNTVFDWKLIHEDTNLGISKECRKCYKTWGTVFKPNWDYLFC